MTHTRAHRGRLGADGRRYRIMVGLLLAAIATPMAATAQAGGGVVGTLVVAHGADRAWNTPVLAIAEQADLDGPVEVAFLMGDEVAEHRFQDGVTRLVEAGAEAVVVVPLLASSFSTHYDQIAYLSGVLPTLSEMSHHHLMEAGHTRPDVAVPIHLTEALDASEEIATIVAERALALVESPADQALFIMGHGPNGAEDYAEWMRNLRPIGDAVRAATGFRDVKIGLVRDDAPEEVRAEAVRSIRETIELQHGLTGREVVVVPLLVSKGFISTQRFPNDLAGLTIAYDGEGLLPHAALADWLSRRVREARAHVE